MPEYTHFKRLSAIKSLAIGKKGHEVEVVNEEGVLQTGVKTNILSTDGTVKACLTNGLTLIAGGTGIADLTLAAPSPGDRAIIRIASLTSGTVVITTATGVTLNGTNNTATLNAIDEALELVYASANTWAIALNIGAVALSTV